MARATAFVGGLVLGVVLGTAVMVTRADPASADVQAAAEQAGVQPSDLLAAMDTTGIGDPWRYLRGVGELPPLAAPLPSRLVRASSPAAPGSGAANARVECIIAKESGGANVANRRGSGAVGILQFMPSTFAAHAREMGHPEWSPWSPAQARAVAAHDLALGRRAQWTVGGC